MTQAGDEGGLAERESELRAHLRPEVQSRLIARLERYLDLSRWGFRLSYVDPQHDSVIYDSPRCRVHFSLLIDLREGDEIPISYARSHVGNDVEVVMEWQGERCFAWHNIMLDPYWEFLEGLTAAEAAEQFRTRTRWRAGPAFRETELGRTLRQADAMVAFHGYLWEHYGERLFSLFDVRQAEVWEEFRSVLREFYELLPDHPFIRRRLEMWGAPPWSVC